MPTLKRLLFNAATLLPGAMQIPFVQRAVDRSNRGTGQPSMELGRYCYAVWLRHLVCASEHGLNTDPKIVAELGPGDSLGLGCAALLSGAGSYHAFDVEAHVQPDANLKIFDTLVQLFGNRAAIPGDDEFPRMGPKLKSYEFPHHILTAQRMARAASEMRIDAIRNSILNVNSADSMIRYRVPWFDPKVIQRNSVDMIISQAVLEHIDELQSAYSTMHQWLNKDGFISHQIDFKSHGTAESWNGHWAYSDFMWKIVRGRRSWLLNRQPHSVHLQLLASERFKIVCHQLVRSPSAITQSELAPRFRNISPDDLTISDAFIQAVKA